MVDCMFHLFEILDHGEDEVALRAFLKACRDDQLFISKGSGDQQAILSTINSKLNSSASRFNGLRVLKVLLPQFPADVFEENAIKWMQQCLKPVEAGKNKQEVLDTSYQVLCIILKMSDNFPEMRRPISAAIVPKIVENFQQIKLDDPSLPALKCIELLMLKYGPSCGQQKNALEKCLLQYIDCQDTYIIERVARCVANFPLLGGGGSLGSNHINRWTQDHQKLCATLHDILNELFCDIREIPNSYNCMTGEKLILLPITESSSLTKVCCLVTRFVNVCKCLQEMHHSEFPLDKALDLDAIMGVACRALAVNSHVLQKKGSPDITMTSVILPQIHTEVFNIINSVITCCRDVLVTYDSIICQLVLQTLKWTSQNNWMCSVRKPYGCLREAACKTLILWLQVSKTSAWVEVYADQLLPLLIEDIWFEKESVTLMVNPNRGKKKKKLKSSDQVTGGKMGGRDLRKLVPAKAANSRVCSAALQLLQWILHSTSIVMKPDVHQILQEKTVSLLLNLQKNMQPQDWPAPFSEGTCRLELYQLLYTLCTEPHPVWPPPTQHTLQIISTGMTDIDCKVSAFCTKAHAAFEKMIHPPAATLQFPVSQEEILESTINSKQIFPVVFNEHSNTSREESSSIRMEANSVKMEIGSVRMETGSTGMESNSPRMDASCSIRIEPGSIRTMSAAKDTQRKQPAQQKELRNETKEKVYASEDLEVLHKEGINDDGKKKVGSVSDIVYEEMDSENEVTLVSDSDDSEKKINQKRTLVNDYPSDAEEEDEDDGLDEEEEEEEEEEELEEEEEIEDDEEEIVILQESDDDKNVNVKSISKFDPNIDKMKNGAPRREGVQPPGTTKQQNGLEILAQPPVTIKPVTEVRSNDSHNRDASIKVNRSVDPLEGAGMEVEDQVEEDSQRHTVELKSLGTQRQGYKTQPALEYDDEEEEDEDGEEDYYEEPDEDSVDDYDEQDDNEREEGEPIAKRVKLDSTDSVNLITKTTEVTDSTVEVNAEEQAEQPVNGVDSGPEEATEEEMLLSFVDAVAE